jgi:hypothetical protein
MKTTHILLCLAVASCGGASKTPHHPSAGELDALAASHDRQANAHDTKYDPDHPKRTFCTPMLERVGECFVSDKNPTERHLKEAEAHRLAAVRYRSMSERLRAAEAMACVGIPDHARDASPFIHDQDILNVETLVTGKGYSHDVKREGIIVTMRKGSMTTQSLQKIVTCYLARMDALGHDSPDDYCPLVPQNVSAAVKETALGLAIEIRSDDPSSVTEILKRAEVLQQRRAEP